jgi:TolB-like protein
MLATRLPKQGRIRVRQVSKAPVDDAEAAVWAQEQKADYVLMGSVVIFGLSVSTDARLLKAGSGAQPLLFSRFGQTPGDVLRHVDLLAREIAAAIAPKTATRPKKRTPITK